MIDVCKLPDASLYEDNRCDSKAQRQEDRRDTHYPLPVQRVSVFWEHFPKKVVGDSRAMLNGRNIYVLFFHNGKSTLDKGQDPIVLQTYNSLMIHVPIERTDDSRSRGDKQVALPQSVSIEDSVDFANEQCTAIVSFLGSS